MTQFEKRGVLAEIQPQVAPRFSDELTGVDPTFSTNNPEFETRPLGCLTAFDLCQAIMLEVQPRTNLAKGT